METFLDKRGYYNTLDLGIKSSNFDFYVSKINENIGSGEIGIAQEYFDKLTEIHNFLNKDDEYFETYRRLCEAMGDNYRVAYAMEKLIEFKRKIGSTPENIMGYVKGKKSYYKSYLDRFLDIDAKKRKIITFGNTDNLYPLESLTLMDINNLPDIDFTMNHPKAEHTYICHPYNKRLYLPIEEYDYELLHDKINEFCRLAQCLGALSISIENIKGETTEGSGSEKKEIEAGVKAGFSKAEASGYVQKQEGEAKSIMSKIAKKQIFDPTAMPFVPKDLVWYSNQPSWQRLVQQRMGEGDIINHQEEISSKDSQVISKSEMDKISADLETIKASVKGNFSKEFGKDIKTNSETHWRVSVVFKPKSELLQDTQRRQSLQMEKTGEGALENSGLREEEKRYLEDLKKFLNDDGQIDDLEKMILEGYRAKYSISEERARELEAMAMELSSCEEKYVDAYKKVTKNGDMTDAEKDKLIMLADVFGISQERRVELERIAKEK